MSDSIERARREVEAMQTIISAIEQLPTDAERFRVFAAVAVLHKLDDLATAALEAAIRLEMAPHPGPPKP